MAYATTTNLVMRAALAHYGTVFSFGRVPQTGELSGVAALCLTPDSWVDGWNAVYRARLAVLAGGIDAINRDVGCEVFQLQHPQGGWYFALRVARHLFPTGSLASAESAEANPTGGADLPQILRNVTSGVHAAAVLLNYGQDRRDTGIAMLPGELFGHGLNGPQRWLTLRGCAGTGCCSRIPCTPSSAESSRSVRTS